MQHEHIYQRIVWHVQVVQHDINVYDEHFSSHSYGFRPNRNAHGAIEEVFKYTKRIDIDNKKLQLFLNGVMLTFNLADDIYRIYNNNTFIGIGIINDSLLIRDIICKKI